MIKGALSPFLCYNFLMNIIQITHPSQLDGVKDTALFCRNAVCLTYRRIFAAISECGTVMGIAQIVDESGVYPGNVGIGYIEVFDGFKKQGVAGALVKRVFDHAFTLKKGVRTGHFTSSGRLHLKKIFERVEMETDIKVIYR